MSIFSFLRTLTAWHCPHWPAAGRAAVRRATIDRYLLLAGPTAANLQQWDCCWGRQTGGQTDGRTPFSAYYADSANNGIMEAFYKGIRVSAKVTVVLSEACLKLSTCFCCSPLTVVIVVNCPPESAIFVFVLFR